MHNSKLTIPRTQNVLGIGVVAGHPQPSKYNPGRLPFPCRCSEVRQATPGFSERRPQIHDVRHRPIPLRRSCTREPKWPQSGMWAAEVTLTAPTYSCVSGILICSWRFPYTLFLLLLLDGYGNPLFSPRFSICLSFSLSSPPCVPYRQFSSQLPRKCVCRRSLLVLQGSEPVPQFLREIYHERFTPCSVLLCFSSKSPPHSLSSSAS